jgi:hypothetical protein
LRLVAPRRSDDVQRRPWELLVAGDDGPWQRVFDEYTGAPDRFHERHYHEFVTFLPYVQIAKSKRLSDLLDVLSEEALLAHAAGGAVARVAAASREVTLLAQRLRWSDGSLMPRVSSTLATLPRLMAPSRISLQPASPARTRLVGLN